MPRPIAQPEPIRLTRNLCIPPLDPSISKRSLAPFSNARVSPSSHEQLRWLLVQSANHILRRDDPDTDLKRHEQKLAKSGSKISKRIAKVTVARKLAVLLHALLTTGEMDEPLRNTSARRHRQPLATA